MLALKRILEWENNGYETILEAIKEADTTIVATLLNADVDIQEIRDGYCFTPLHIASIFDEDEIVTLLVQGGSNVDAIDIHGDTPLMKACFWKSVNSVKILLRAGCDVNYVNDSTGGDTAVSMTLHMMHDPDDETRSFEILQQLHGAGQGMSGDVEAIVNEFVRPQYKRILSDLLFTNILPKRGPKTLKKLARNAVRQILLANRPGNIYGKVRLMKINDNPVLQSLIIDITE